ncbi:hypothetical protein A6F49_09070 [Enteractinococcus helveticum]|uniref:HTH marR-type domain-containing protein n=2 Tax=Enteractinococcus helveticum TaxID=1837282 RepID=A0A1B7M0F6_9MICC|nr:hypothetical protein A6F49_09070 [Enteractinococcus helveticum]
MCPQSMQGILRNLEINELIERKSQAGDRRQYVILITAKGPVFMRSLESRIATFDASLVFRADRARRDGSLGAYCGECVSMPNLMRSCPSCEASSEV